MEYEEWKEPKSCPCYQKCDGNWDFIKILGNEDGIEVYQHRPQTDDLNNELLFTKTNSTDGNVYIVHNKCAMPVYPDDFLPTFDTHNIKCPRCQKNAIHAQRLLDKVPLIDKVVIGICDHCINQTNQTCKECEKAIQKFITIKDRLEVPCKKIKTWVSNIKEAFKELINSKIPIQYRKHTISEPDLAQASSRAYKVRSAQSVSKSQGLQELQDGNKLYGKKDDKNKSQRDLRLNTKIFDDEDTNKINEKITKEFKKYDSDTHINEMKKKSHQPDFNEVDDINYGPMENNENFYDSYATRERIQKYKHDLQLQDNNKYYYEKYDVPLDKNEIDMKYSEKERKRYERSLGHENREEYNARHYYDYANKNVRDKKIMRYLPSKNRFHDLGININEILNGRFSGGFRNLNKEYEREKWNAQDLTSSRTLEHLELGLSDDEQYIKKKKRKKRNYLRRSVSDTLLNIKDYTLTQESKITQSKIQVKSIISDTQIPATIVSQIKQNQQFQKLKDSLELDENKFISDQDKFYQALAKLIDASILSDHLKSKNAKRGRLGGRHQKAKTPILQKRLVTIEHQSGEFSHREFGKIFIHDDLEKDFNKYLFPKQDILTKEVKQDNSADLIARTIEMEHRRVQEQQRKQKLKEEKRMLAEEKQTLKNEKRFVEEIRKKLSIGGTDQRHQGKKDIIDSEKQTAQDDIMNKENQFVADGGQQLTDKDYIGIKGTDHDQQDQGKKDIIASEKQTAKDKQDDTIYNQFAVDGEQQVVDKDYTEKSKRKRAGKQIIQKKYSKKDKQKHIEEELIRNDSNKYDKKHKIKSSSGKIKTKEKKKKTRDKLDHGMQTNTDNYEATTEMQLEKTTQPSEQNKQEMEITEKSLQDEQKYNEFKVGEPALVEQNYKIPDGDELQQEIDNTGTEQYTPTDDQLMTSQNSNDYKNDQQMHKDDKKLPLKMSPPIQQDKLRTKKLPQTQEVDNNNLRARKSLEKQTDYENLTRMSQQAQKDDKNDHKGENEENSSILKKKGGNLDAIENNKIEGSFSAKVKTKKEISKEDLLIANVTSMHKKKHLTSDLSKDGIVSPVKDLLEANLTNMHTKDHLASGLPKDSIVSPGNKIQSEVPTKIPTIFKEIDMKKVRLIKTNDNTTTKLVTNVKNRKNKRLSARKTSNEPKRGKRFSSLTQENRCNLCQISNESDSDNIFQTNTYESSDEMIIIDKIHKHKNMPLIELEQKDDVPFEFTKTTFSENFVDQKQEPTTTVLKKEPEVPQETRGFMRYALSDRKFIDKGWTILPTEEVVRKVNVYRMRPSHPEFDWFFLNKNKGLLRYDTGEKLAEIDEKGRGRWFYKNGIVALEYYDCEELNAKQRVVVYGNCKPDLSGRSRPSIVLATFDYLGNAVVLDHTGKIRLKYNQSEGVMLDRSLGPVTNWKWHSLNDPPELLQVMVETRLRFKDRDILKLSDETDHKQQKRVDEEVVAIEREKLIKEQSKKLTRKYKPYQIRMKALKINDCFALRVVDQATVYLLFRDGKTNMRLNLGMLLDHKEIIDTDVANVGLVTSELEPMKTDSLVAIQRNVDRARRFEQARIDREQRIRPTLPQASADKLIAAATRPQYHAAASLVDCGNNVDYSSCPYKYKKQSCCNVYYNTRIV